MPTLVRRCTSNDHELVFGRANYRAKGSSLWSVVHLHKHHKLRWVAVCAIEGVGLKPDQTDEQCMLKHTLVNPRARNSKGGIGFQLVCNCQPST